MTKPLWTPSPERIARSNLTRFMDAVNREHGLTLDGYDALYDWSIADIPAFWEALWRFVDIQHSAPYTSVLENPRMPGAAWFKGARLNFAENLLRYRDDRPALVSVREGGGVAAQLTYAELFAQVVRMAGFLRENGRDGRGSRGRLSAQLRRDCSGHAGGYEPGGRLVVVQPGFRL